MEHLYLKMLPLNKSVMNHKLQSLKSPETLPLKKLSYHNLLFYFHEFLGAFSS